MRTLVSADTQSITGPRTLTTGTANARRVPLVELTRRVPLVESTRGVTLVELMVAMTIGLLVIAGLAALFAQTASARNEVDRAGQQLENGRFALELLRNDIRQAGYFGGLVAGSPSLVAACIPRTGVALNATNLGWESASAQVPMPIHGYAAGDVPATETCFSTQKPNTDALILRSVESVPMTIAAASGSSYANDWFLQTSNCANRAIDPATVPFIVAPGGSTALASFTLHEKDCATPALVRRVAVRAYYVGRCSVCTGGGDSIPSLRMVELAGNSATSNSVVEGIDALRIEYALDTTATGRIDRITTCKDALDPCTSTDWGNVIGVQLYVLARSLAPTPGHVDAKTYALGQAGTLVPLNDGYRRHLYSGLVTANNLAGPRER